MQISFKANITNEDFTADHRGETSFTKALYQEKPDEALKILNDVKNQDEKTQRDFVLSSNKKNGFTQFSVALYKGYPAVAGEFWELVKNQDKETQKAFILHKTATRNTHFKHALYKKEKDLAFELFDRAVDLAPHKAIDWRIPQEIQEKTEFKEILCNKILVHKNLDADMKLNYLDRNRAGFSDNNYNKLRNILLKNNPKPDSSEAREIQTVLNESLKKAATPPPALVSPKIGIRKVLPDFVNKKIRQFIKALDQQDLDKALLVLEKIKSSKNKETQKKFVLSTKYNDFNHTLFNIALIARCPEVASEILDLVKDQDKETQSMFVLSTTTEDKTQFEFALNIEGLNIGYPVLVNKFWDLVIDQDEPTQRKFVLTPNKVGLTPYYIALNKGYSAIASEILNITKKVAPEEAAKMAA